MESLQLTLVALMPSIGALISIIVMVFGIVRQFRQLRVEVRDDSTIKAIHADNKRLNAMYKMTLDEIDKLKDEIRTLSELNQEAISTMNRTNRGE